MENLEYFLIRSFKFTDVQCIHSAMGSEKLPYKQEVQINLSTRFSRTSDVNKDKGGFDRTQVLIEPDAVPYLVQILQFSLAHFQHRRNCLCWMHILESNA